MQKIKSRAKYILSIIFLIGIFFANQQVISKSYVGCTGDCAIVTCEYNEDTDTYELTCHYDIPEDPCECDLTGDDPGEEG